MTMNRIKFENAADYLLVFFIFATLVTGAFTVPFIITVLLAVLILTLTGFYFYSGYLILAGKNPGGKWKTNLLSILLLVITGVSLALFLLIIKDEIRTSLKILSVLNMIFAVYSLIGPMNREISVKHLIVSFLLAGFGVFV
jgi:hypothetical protein